MTVTIFALKT